MNEALCSLKEVLHRGVIGDIEEQVASLVGYIVVQGGKVVVANATAAKLLQKGELVGQNLRDIVPPSVKNEHDGWVEDWRKGGARTREMGLPVAEPRGLAIMIHAITYGGNDAELAVILPSESEGSK